MSPQLAVRHRYLHAFLVSLVACIAAANPPRAPQRIVAMGPNSAEIICSLGACDRIVGVSKFCVYPPELAGRPQVGGLYDPDLERIAALRPDMLVTRGRNDALDSLCARLAIRVYEDTTDSIAGIERTVLELGELLGRGAAAEETVGSFRRELAAIRERVSGELRPRVFMTVSRQPDRLANILTTGKGTFLDEMIEIAGGTNVFGHLDMRYPEVSPEAVLAQRPEVIIELMPDLELTPELERQMRDHWRALGEVPAVGNGRVFFLSDDHCLIPSPRYHRIIGKVSRILHPESAGE